MTLKTVLNNEIVSQINMDEDYTIYYTANITIDGIIRSLDIRYRERQITNVGLIGLNNAINDALDGDLQLTFFVDNNKIAEFNGIDSCSLNISEDQGVTIIKTELAETEVESEVNPGE